MKILSYKILAPMIFPRLKKDSGINSIFRFSIGANLDTEEIFQKIDFEINGQEASQTAKKGNLSEINNSLYGPMIMTKIRQEAPAARIVLLEMDARKKELKISYFTADKTILKTSTH